MASRPRSLALLRADTLLEPGAPGRGAGGDLAAEIAANPLNVDVSLTDARISLAERDIEAAKIKVGRALEIDPDSLQALMLDVQIKSGEGRYTTRRLPRSNGWPSWRRATTASR